MRNLLFPASTVIAVSAIITGSLFIGCFHTDTEPGLKPVVVVPNAGFPSAKSINAKLGRGINFGNALDAPMEGDWGVTLKPEWFHQIADSGFTTVRLPVRWSSHSLELAPYTIDSIFMNRVV
jgi:aryl-phospho-beta-D-glucosidase BglC (GH1 family)